MSGEKILVADDRRENLLFLANSVLRPEGYEVLTAVDGKQALDKALAEKPDLIITDLKMPRMSGLEMMSALHKAGTDIPVILTTFYGSEQAAIQAFRLGARDYIIKPYEVKEMLESVERALMERRLRREKMNLAEGVEVSRHLEERVRQLHSMCGIGQALYGLHEPDEVMRVAVEAAIYLLGAEAGQLFVLNGDTQQLEVRALRGPSEGRARSVQQLGADRITTQVLQSGRALMGERSGAGEDKVPRLAVPLRINEKIVGVLGIDGKPAHTFDDNDRYQLGILANFVAASLSTAQQIEQLKSQVAILSQQVAMQAGGGAEGVPPAALADSAAEAERLSAELRNLAAAAQVLAARLQVKGESFSTMLEGPSRAATGTGA
ncbi:MAG: response regulator [Anaerolineae bacterium]|jgi:two-component system, NtrC family, sensor kinase